MMRATFEAFAGQWQATGDGPAVDPHEDNPERRYRAIFISDIHLGTAGCQAEALLDFMRDHPSEYLYLVGDIVDGWQLRRCQGGVHSG